MLRLGRDQRIALLAAAEPQPHVLALAHRADPAAEHTGAHPILVARRHPHELTAHAAPHLEPHAITPLAVVRIEHDQLAHAQFGVARRRLAMVLNQLRGRFGALPDAVVARVAAAGMAELNTWSMRLLTAAGLADVFAAS